MSEIRPKYVDGEPVCSGKNCPAWIEYPELCDDAERGGPCVPALRRDRDKYCLALESLTPGGSEFVNDEKACVEFVRNERSRKMEAIMNFSSNVTSLKPSWQSASRSVMRLGGDCVILKQLY